MEPLLLRIGNEVRQTLHHVMGLMELASEEPLSERQAQYLLRSRESADQLVRTIGDLTELARPNVPASKAGRFALTDALAEIAELMSVLASQKGLTFHWTVDTKAPSSITGDKALFQDMLRRLLENAVRFTAAGGIRLLVTQTGAEPAQLIIAVSDSGPGIPKSVLSALDSPVNVSPVRGLGLRIVMKRLADFGGKMSISSDSSGATVRLALPISIAEPSHTPSSTATKSDHRPLPLKLLVAEDSDESFLLIQAYTQSEGHHVLRALNGEEAVEMAKAADYDFVVMDANMPVMDGYTATGLIRQWETKTGQARRPILILSADDSETQMRNGATVGCSGYLTKPTTKAKLLTALAYYTGPAIQEPSHSVV